MPSLPKKSKPEHWITHRKPYENANKRNAEIYNGSMWRRLSKQVEYEEAICRSCKQDATGMRGETDHIKPIELGGAIFDRDNLQRLCKSCHARKSAKDKKRYDRND